MTAGGNILKIVIGNIFRRIVRVWIIDIQSKNKIIKQQVNISLDGLGIKQVESASLLGVHIDGNII